MDWQQEGDTMKAHGANGREYAVRARLGVYLLMVNRDTVTSENTAGACQMVAESFESALRKGELKQGTISSAKASPVVMTADEVREEYEAGKEETHQEALKRLNLQPGDKVRVERKEESKERGWTLRWNPSMDRAVGMVCPVVRRSGADGGVCLGGEGGHHWFPAHVLTVVERAQKDEPKKLGDVLGWDYEHPEITPEELHLPVPDGWEVVDYRRPRDGDMYMNAASGNPLEGAAPDARAILRRKDDPAEAEGYWMVHRSGNTFAPATYQKEKSAIAVAKRLANKYPGETIHVFKTAYQVTATTTVESVPCGVKGDNQKGHE